DTGVPCRHRHFDDMIHAYLNLESLAPDACAATYREIAAFLNGD
ncbi:MAG TPA: alpha/beta hydrolase, partial [Alcanivorax sp.]|nr:alpha/beta hydrolase [Alcanivorax sp.]